jgi:hypothetical protein
MKTLILQSVSMLLFLLVVTGGLSAQDATETPDPHQPQVLSAFFGLDNALPDSVNRLCDDGANRDGMPVIFSHHVNADTLQPEDFAVITAAGVVNTPMCVTLGPAVDIGELATALLIGELGAAETDPPVRVEIVGEILSGSGNPDSPAVAEDETALDFSGLEVAVTPLAAGPSLIVAESVPEDEWTRGRRGRQAQGSSCPLRGTVQIVRVAWSGGVTKAGGGEITDVEREQYQVTVVAADNTEVLITPFAIGDLNDGDNYHLLCLDVEGTPQKVSFSEGYLYDPNADELNPHTTGLSH